MTVRPPSQRAIPPGALRWWWNDAAGSMTVFGVFVFVIMFFVAGVAVDMARVEHERVRLQGATDRSVLAATMLRENISGATPEQIVQVFMEAEGAADHIRWPIEVMETGAGRAVRLDVRATLPPTFTRWLGVDDLVLGTPARAVEALGRIDFELVLVLDVSGSMMDFGRMENLRSAVLAFAESLYATTAEGQLGLTIVPYSTEVVLPGPVLNTLTNLAAPTNMQLTGAPSYCIEFGNWNAVRGLVNGLGDTLNILNPILNIVSGNLVGAPWRRRWCDLRSNTTFTQPTASPYLHSAAEVEAYMGTLGPVWGTSIDLGVITGGLFFDPALRPAIETMVANGSVNPIYADRPFDWDRPHTVRAMILMTDGENCCFHANHAATRTTSVEVQDRQTLDACRGLKDRGVMIYAIAFEAPAGGVELMRNCATSTNHFFSTSSNALIDIFRGISTHIQLQALRLTD